MTETKTTRDRLSALFSSRLFRAAVSIGLLAALLATVDLRELGSTLGSVSPRLLALGVLVFLIANMVSISKWSLIISAQGDRVSFFYLTTLFYIGLFFNNFLPTNFGGDVVKAFKLSRTTGHGAEAAGSVVLDRVSSVLALLLIAVVPALIELRLLGTGILLLVLGMLLLLVLLIGLFASERAARRLGGLFRADPFGVRKHLRSFYYSLHEFRGHKSTMLWVILISLAYQVLQVLTVYVLALALGIGVPLVYYFIFIPIVLAVSMVPISLNGLGVRELTWVVLFGQVGVSQAEAISMSILAFLVMTVVSLAGGVFYMFDRSVPSRDQVSEHARATPGEAGHGGS